MAGNETELERMLVRMVGDATEYLAMLRQAKKETEKVTQEVVHEVEEVEGIFERVSNATKGWSSSLQTAGRSLAWIGGVIGGLGGSIATFSLMSAGRFEQTQIAFETMLGSAKETEKTLKALTVFAAKTPFEMPEIQSAARGLIQFGERGDEMMETLNILGNAASGTSTNFGMLALIFNQVRGVGKLLTQDFRQLSTRGIISLQDFVDQGIAPTTVAAQEMLSKGQISFEDLRNVLKALSSEGGRFFNLMERQSESLLGLWSTLSDAVNILKRQIGEEIAPVVKSFVKDLIAWVDVLSSLSSETKAAIGYWTLAVAAIGALTAGLGGLLILIGQVISAISGISAAIAVLTGMNLLTFLFAVAAWLPVIFIGVGLIAAAALQLNANLKATRAGAEAAGNALKSFKEQLQIDDVAKETEADKLAEYARRIAKEREAIQKQLEGKMIFGVAIGAGAKELDARLDTLQEAMTKVRDRMRELSQAADEVKESTADMIPKEAQAHFDSLTGSLKEQIDTWGRTSDEVEIYRLQQMGLPKEMIEEVRVQQKILAGLKEEKKEREDLAARIKSDVDKDRAARDAENKRLTAAGKALTEKYLTPAEKEAKQLAELRELRDKNKISIATYNRAMEDLNKTVREAMQPLRAVGEGTAEFQVLLQEAALRTSAARKEIRIPRSEPRPLTFGERTYFPGRSSREGAPESVDPIVVALHKLIEIEENRPEVILSSLGIGGGGIT